MRWVRPACYILEFFRFLLERYRQFVEFGKQRGGDGLHCCNVDAGRENVVGGLGGVDVVIGVHRLEIIWILTCLFPRLLFVAGGECRNDLIGVHVGRGAGAGLENVDRELVVVFASDNLFGSSDNGVPVSLVNYPQFTVRDGSGTFDLPQSCNVVVGEGTAANREVLYSTLCLRRAFGNLLPHSVSDENILALQHVVHSNYTN